MGSDRFPPGDRRPRSLRPWRSLAERERRADERDALADDREALADHRDSEADLREKWLDERERRQGHSAGHPRAARSAERAGRDQPASGRASAQSGHLAAGQPDLSQQLEWAIALRKQGAAAIAALAATEEKIARFHDELAALRPARADEYRRIAEQARTHAARAREIVRTFNPPQQPQ